MNPQEIEGATKPPRRRLTPEERIAKHAAEIEKAKAQQKKHVHDLIEEAVGCLHSAQQRARQAQMTVEAEMVTAALKALETST